MTYCVAWKDDENVYLISESIITSKEQYTTNERSSFGEYYLNKNNSEQDGIEEGCIKINEISNKFAIAYAGIIDEGNNVSIMVKEAIEEYGLDIEQAIKMVFKNSIESKETDFLLCFYDNKNKPRIISFINRTIKEEEFTQIGSGITNEKFTQAVHSVVGQVKKGGGVYETPERKLTTVLAMAQYASTSIDLIDVGAGGIYYGIFIGKNGIEWANDISYYYYKELVTGGSFTTIMRRNKLYTVNSSYSKNPILLQSKFYAHEIKVAYENNLFDEMKKEVNYAKTKYFILFSHFTKKIIIVETDYNMKNDHFCMWVEKEKEVFNYRMVFNPIFGIFLKDNSSSDLRVSWIKSEKINEEISFDDFIKSQKDSNSVREIKKLHATDVLNKFFSEYNDEIIPILIDIDFLNKEISNSVFYYESNGVNVGKVNIDKLIVSILKYSRLDVNNKSILTILYGADNYIENSDIILDNVNGEKNCITKRIFIRSDNSDATSEYLMNSIRINAAKHLIKSFIICAGFGEYYYGLENLSAIYNITAMKSREDEADWIYERIKYQFIDYPIDEALGITALQQQGIFE